MIDKNGWITLQSLRKNLRDKDTVIENDFGLISGVEGDMIDDGYDGT